MFARRQRGDGKQLEPDEVYEYGSPTTSGRRFDGWVAN
jgi:hypothetical protein